jgi:hypothetical protein
MDAQGTSTRRGGRCCAPEPASPRRPVGRSRVWWRLGGSAALGGVALALVPKCPLCLAAWLGALTVGLSAVLDGVRGVLW